MWRGSSLQSAFEGREVAGGAAAGTVAAGWSGTGGGEGPLPGRAVQPANERTPHTRMRTATPDCVWFFMFCSFKEIGGGLSEALPVHFGSTENRPSTRCGNTPK